MTDQPKVYTDVRDILDGLTEAFVETGIGWIEAYDQHRDTTLLSPVQQRKYVRRLARELKRPFIIAFGGTYVRWDTKEKVFDMTLTMPNTKAMAPIMAPLLLVGELVQAKWKQDNQPCCFLSGMFQPYKRVGNGLVPQPEKPTRMREFYFKGKTGEKILLGFIKNCRTDPVCRAALKIT